MLFFPRLSAPLSAHTSSTEVASKLSSFPNDKCFKILGEMLLEKVAYGCNLCEICSCNLLFLLFHTMP